MSYLLAATDFSDIGSNAVQYTCALARAHKFEVVVFHSFTLPLVVSELPIPALSYEEALECAEDTLEEHLSQLREQYTDVPVRGKVYFGELAEGIDKYATKYGKPYLVLVGNSNQGTHANWLDSRMLEVFRNIDAPVAAIPPGVSAKPVARICLAWDGKGGELAVPLRHLSSLVNIFQAELHILITDTDGRSQDNLPDNDPRAMAHLKQMNAKFHFQYNTTIEGEIEKFISSQKIDLLVIIPREHSFWGGIFHKSHTKGIANRVHLPLVVLPERLTS